MTRCAPRHCQPSNDPVQRRPRGAWTGGLALCRRAPAAALCALAIGWALPASAGAKIVEVGAVKVGIQQRNAEGMGEPGASPKTFENPLGHPVMHSTALYAIYWDPYNIYDGDWQGIIDNFLASLAASDGSLQTVFAVDGQYEDATGTPATTHPAYRGSYTDTNAYPSAGCTDPEPLSLGSVTCITDAQIRAQLESFISANGLPKGMETIYYVLTPPGVTVCLDEGGPSGHCSDHKGAIAETPEQEAGNESYRNSFCSYHGAITPTNPETGDRETIIYGMIPWTAGGEGIGDVEPHLPAYDCQDGGFAWTTEGSVEKEQPNTQPRRTLEAKETAELEKLNEECRKRESETTGAEKEEVQKNCAKQRAEIEEASAKELEKIAEQEALEAPHVQEPHQAEAEYDTDGDYDQGLADVIVGQIAQEQQDIVTDPLLNAWHDSANYEVADECRNDFWTPGLSPSYPAKKHTHAGLTTNETLAGGHYYLNDGFLLGALKLDYPGAPVCGGFIDLSVQFTAPAVVNAEEIVAFDGMESAISLDWTGLSLTAPGQRYAIYTWEFKNSVGEVMEKVSGPAPGTPPCTEPWLPGCAASVFHKFKYGGTYYVTLQVTDTGGNVAEATHQIAVNGPAAPASPGSEGGTGGTGGSGSGAGAGKSGGSGTGGGGSGSGATGAGSPTYPAPSARAAAASGSLEAALRHGLRVGYDVNEQVAGTVQALIPAKLAHRLHIRGRLATGLPAGYAPAVVIGHAVLVTRRGGHGVLRLRFSKATARALRRLRRVTITLRMALRNAEASHPKTATLLSTVVLQGRGAGRRRHK